MEKVYWEGNPYVRKEPTVRLHSPAITERLEYELDLNAFIDLHEELLGKYLQININDDWFEQQYTDEHCWINKFIKSWRQDNPIRIERRFMDIAVEKLSYMERDLYEIGY